MSEETNEQTTEQESDSQSTETLDDLYGEFKVEQKQTVKSNMQETQPDVTQVSTGNAPDPVSDPDGHKQYMDNILKETSALKTQFQGIQSAH